MAKMREFDFTKQDRQEEQLAAIRELNDTMQSLCALLMGWMVKA